MNTRDAERRAEVLKRVLAGRKRVIVSKWKWNHPQEVGTLAYVPLPPQTVPLGPRRKKKLLRFSEFIDASKRFP